jgi:hypothetical protein
MTYSLGKRPKQQPIKCQGCERDHVYKDSPHKGDRMRTIYNMLKDNTLEYMSRSVPRIYVGLDNKQTYYHSHIIEVESNIDNQSMAIMIYFGS